MKVLDLFCGAGGAAMGLHRAWPDAEIIGVDIKPQKHYPFTFVLGDAMTFPLEGYDFIWASPPCQAYSCTKSLHKNKHANLLEEVRTRLLSVCVPFVIENVNGAPLITPRKLCGSVFGLAVRRHRYFEVNGFSFLAHECRHELQPEPLDVTGSGGPGGRHRKPKNLAQAREAMGIDWMNRGELAQAIPPAYSEFIAKQVPNDRT